MSRELTGIRQQIIEMRRERERAWKHVRALDELIVALSKEAAAAVREGYAGHRRFSKEKT